MFPLVLLFEAVMPHAVLLGRTLCVLLDVDKNGAIDLEEFVGTWELERERLFFGGVEVILVSIHFRHLSTLIRTSL